MSDEKDDAGNPGKDDKSEKWKTGAKVGAAVGSAAIAAALIYAGRHRMKRLEDIESAKPKAGLRYENEPDLDDDDDDLTEAYYGHEEE